MSESEPTVHVKVTTQADGTLGLESQTAKRLREIAAANKLIGAGTYSPNAPGNRIEIDRISEGKDGSVAISYRKLRQSTYQPSVEIATQVNVGFSALTWRKALAQQTPPERVIYERRGEDQ